MFTVQFPIHAAFIKMSQSVIVTFILRNKWNILI